MKCTFLNIILFPAIILQGAYGQELTVLTYNIKYDNPSDSLNNWDNRKDFLTSQLRFYEPIVFGTQEGLKHQLNDIQSALANYTYFGVGRDDGKDAGEFSAIFYDSTKVKMLRHDTFWLSETPKKPSKGWDAAIKRICTYALFETVDSPKRFYVFNTHFDHVGEKARLESTKLILEKIKQLNSENFPTVLIGDLNLEPNEEGIQLIVRQMADTHIVAGKNAHGPSGTFNRFNFDKPVKRRIDYIFVSKGFKVEKSGILSDSFDCRYPSDHFPVYAVLGFDE